MAVSEPQALASARLPILLELDETSWARQIDHVESWLNIVLTVQAEFHRLARRTAEKVHEPHFKKLLDDVVGTAARQEQAAEELFQTIGRSPSRVGQRVAPLLAAARAAWADALGMLGSAAPPFRDMQQLHLACVDSASAFAVAEQLGLALGIRELAEAAYDVVADKFAHQLLLQELTLELAATAILQHTELAEPRGETLRWQSQAPGMNVGPKERYARLAVAGVTGALAIGMLRRGRLAGLPLAGVATAEVLTALTRYCPVNQTLGINNAR